MARHRHSAHVPCEDRLTDTAPDNRWHVGILDVEGTRVVILAEDFPATAAQDHAELLAIVESIRIAP